MMHEFIPPQASTSSLLSFTCTLVGSLLALTYRSLANILANHLPPLLLCHDRRLARASYAAVMTTTTSSKLAPGTHIRLSSLRGPTENILTFIRRVVHSDCKQLTSSPTFAHWNIDTPSLPKYHLTLVQIPKLLPFPNNHQAHLSSPFEKHEAAV